MKTLTRCHPHAYAISRLTRQLSKDMRVVEGSFYPALRPLELTPEACKKLQTETDPYRHFTSAITRIMETV